MTPRTFTTTAALSINSSHTGFSAERAQTPLGERGRVFAHTASGAKREIALVSNLPLAAAVAGYLDDAREELVIAARLIQKDREETRR